MSKYLLLVIFTSLDIRSATIDNLDFFASTSHMVNLLKTQGKLIKFLEEYKAANITDPEQLEIFDTYLEPCKKEHEKAMKDVPHYLGNPLNALTLIKSLYVDLELLGTIVDMKVWTTDEIGKFPTEEDFTGAVRGLHRMQAAYNLRISDLSEGILTGNFRKSMTANDCFEIGNEMLKMKDYKRTVEWLLEAIYKCKDDYDYEIHKFTMVVALEIILQILHGLGKGESEYFSILEMELKELERYVTTPDFDYEPLIPDRRLIDIIYDELEEQLAMIPNPNRNYERLCQGELPVPAEKVKSLKCFFLRRNLYMPLLRIKVEQLHQGPLVLLFYDVISDEEINVLQFQADPLLERSGVMAPEVCRRIVTRRVSKTAWFDDNIPATMKISGRVAQFTGLNTNASESLQVANYGIGGLYDPHHDFFLPNTSTLELGNRIATVLFYLSDVAQGGATIFMDLGITVFPVKYAAIFWYNLHPTGEPDNRTLHAACPVLRGSKWVASKWFREKGQEFSAPCTNETNYL